MSKVTGRMGNAAISKGNRVLPGQSLEEALVGYYNDTTIRIRLERPEKVFMKNFVISENNLSTFIPVCENNDDDAFVWYMSSVLIDEEFKVAFCKVVDVVS